MDQSHKVVIASESWLLVLGMVMFAALALVPLLRAGKLLRALSIVKSSPDTPAATKGDYRVARLAGVFGVVWRGLVGVGALFVA